MTKRRESYEIVAKYLNETGAPSNIWSNLERLLEPNGTFLKQRDKIIKLEHSLLCAKKALEHYSASVASINSQPAEDALEEMELAVRKPESF